MALDTTPYGISLLPDSIPTGSDALQIGRNWRTELAREVAPYQLSPSEKRMLLTITPLLKETYIRTLRRTVLGEDTHRVALYATSLITNPSQKISRAMGLQYHRPLRANAADIQALTPPPASQKPAAENKLLLPSPEEIEEYTALGTTAYARARAQYKDRSAELSTHLAHIHEHLTAFAEKLYEDVGAADQLLDACNESARKAADLLANDMAGPNAHHLAAEQITFHVEQMLEDALLKAVHDMHDDPDLTERYIQTAQALVRLHVDAQKHHPNSII